MPVVRSRARRTSTTPSSHGGPQRGFVAASHAMVPGSGGLHEKVNNATVGAVVGSKTSRRKSSHVTTTTSQIRGEVSGLQKSKKRPTWTFEAANSHLLCTNSSTATTVAASEALALENATVPHRWPPSSVSTHRVVHHHHQASNFAEKSVGVVGPLGEHGGHVVAAASATSEAAVSTSFSCFGALCSVVRAATDYCRYGNLKQYLLIDPNTGEPLKDTIYTASHLTTEASSTTSLGGLRGKRTSSQSVGVTSNGSDYILPPDVRAEIVAAAKKGKLKQYLQLRRESLQLRNKSISDESSPCNFPESDSSNNLFGQGLLASNSNPTMHAAVVSRNLQRERTKHGSWAAANLPPSIAGYADRGGVPIKYINGKPAALARGHVKHIKSKGKKGKKNKVKETYDLIVNIDLQEWQLSNEQVAEYKEVFMLFDKDEDGVLSFPELTVVMKSLGQRPSDEELLKMVQEVSEDPVYHTIEFNEFLQLLSKQQRSGTNYDSLKDAFSIFDKDDDGFIPVNEMRNILQSLGDKMTEHELDEMMVAADSDQDGFINYEDFVTVLCGKKRSPGGEDQKRNKGPKKGHKKKSTKVSSDIKEVPNEDDNSHINNGMMKLSLENGNISKLNDNENPNTSIVIVENEL